MEVEDAGDVVCEDGSPLVCLQAVRVLTCIDQLEEIDDVDETDLELWQVCAQKSGSRKSFVGGDITARCHDEIRLLTLIVRCPLPDAYALGAVLNGLVHSEELQVLLFVGDDDVDIILTTKAVVHGGEQTIGIRRKVDTHNIRALVGNNVEETRILVRKAIVVLTPDGSCEEDVERRDLLPPFDLETLLDPFAVLVDHTVNDVDERFVAV